MKWRCAACVGAFGAWSAWSVVACRGSSAQVDPTPEPSVTVASSTAAPVPSGSAGPSSVAPAPPDSALALVDASAPATRALALASTLPPASAAPSSIPSARASASASASAEPPTPSSPPTPSTPPEPPARPVATRVSGSHYVVDVSAPGDCRVGADCAVTIRLEARDGFHVNKDYPHRFDANDSATAQFLGSGAGGRAFSRGSGFFALQAETVSTLGVRFRARAAGNVTVAGTYAMSVCTATVCTLDSPALSLTIPIR